MDILTGINTRVTPQNQPVPGRNDQVKNSAGGFVFEISDAERLRRFLILGTDAGTYYTNAADLTRANAEVPIRMALDEPDTLLSTILDVSLRGAAPKQNATLFALAIACSFGDLDFRQKALAALPKIARTGTHLFIFARYVEQFRGWGRSLRRSVGDWYMSKTPEQVAYQAVKYRQREGWSHRDLLRLSHPQSGDAELNATFDWITHNSLGEETPKLIHAFTKANAPGATVELLTELIREHGLTWEMLPDEALSKAEIWNALLDTGVPMTALIRQLPRLTRLGVVSPLGGRTDDVVAQLTNHEALRKARVHPINLLVAHRTYSGGQSARGSSSWSPVPKIIDALDDAFYKAFEFVEPAGKHTMLALDVSGSMGGATTATGLNAREASAALALVTMATEPATMTVGFTGGSWGWGRSSFTQPVVDNLTPLNISPRQRLDDVIRSISGLPFGSTDCALPMLYAAKKNLEVDTFVIYTDNETWAGSVHPYQALKQYRAQSGIDAKVVVVGMTATEFSIADPRDPGMLDVVGFDTAVPSLISQFSRGL